MTSDIFSCIMMAFNMIATELSSWFKRGHSMAADEPLCFIKVVVPDSTPLDTGCLSFYPEVFTFEESLT